MAFLSKVGKIFSQSSSSGIGSHLQPSKLSIFQTLRFMSGSQVFVGGLSYRFNDLTQRKVFSKYGKVVEARVVSNRDTGRSLGFGFVTFSTNEEASTAIQALDQQELHGCRIRCSSALGPPGYGPTGTLPEQGEEKRIPTRTPREQGEEKKIPTEQGEEKKILTGTRPEQGEEEEKIPREPNGDAKRPDYTIFVYLK